MNIQEKTSSILDDLIQIRQTIHQNPELSGKEYYTTAFIVDYLKSLGLEVVTGPEGVGAIATLVGEEVGKTLALRADIDALPIQESTNLAFKSKFNNVMHACGHDIHTTVLLGTAKVLSEYKKMLKGNIKFIFQPAEETMSGAIQLIQNGVLENPSVDSIVALHTWPELSAGEIGIKYGTMMSSSDSFEIVIKGIGGHAAHPHKAVDPILIAGHVITTLQSIVSREIPPTDSVVITIGEIHGGQAANIIPETVTLRGTVRNSSEVLRSKVPLMMERIIRNTVQSMRGEVDFSYRLGCPPLVADETLMSMFEQSTKEALGDERLVTLPIPSMGSEDFAFYLERVPGFLFRLGTGNENPNSRVALHNPRIEFDDTSIYYGVIAMSNFAVNYLKD